MLGNLHGLVAVAAGGQHSMALGATGFVVTWGSNAYLQLGMPGHRRLRHHGIRIAQDRPHRLGFVLLADIRQLPQVTVSQSWPEVGDRGCVAVMLPGRLTLTQGQAFSMVA
ncbi:RCC1 domain-containing protein [Nonomuraea cavernae]|uniref:RCC1 domain-containing protein n=1 Tax=Nonomuraea cavernae TaxID=2045107 RepID=UPI0033BFD35C